MNENMHNFDLFITFDTFYKEFYNVFGNEKYFLKNNRTQNLSSKINIFLEIF